MDLVAIDHVALESAPAIAEMLRGSGFHPVIDDNPRYALRGANHHSTAVYVPADEADKARVVLAAYYDEAQAGMNDRLRKLPPLWDGFLGPACVGVMAGTIAGFLSQQVGIVIGAVLIGFLLAVQAKAYLKHRRHSDADTDAQ